MIPRWQPRMPRIDATHQPESSRSWRLCQRRRPAALIHSPDSLVIVVGQNLLRPRASELRGRIIRQSARRSAVDVHHEEIGSFPRGPDGTNRAPASHHRVSAFRPTTRGIFDPTPSADRQQSTLKLVPLTGTARALGTLPGMSVGGLSVSPDFSRVLYGAPRLLVRSRHYARGRFLVKDDG